MIKHDDEDDQVMMTKSMMGMNHKMHTAVLTIGCYTL